MKFPMFNIGFVLLWTVFIVTGSQILSPPIRTPPGYKIYRLTNMDASAILTGLVGPHYIIYYCDLPNLYLTRCVISLKLRCNPDDMETKNIGRIVVLPTQVPNHHRMNIKWNLIDGVLKDLVYYDSSAYLFKANQIVKGRAQRKDIGHLYKEVDEGVVKYKYEQQYKQKPKLRPLSGLKKLSEIIKNPFKKNRLRYTTTESSAALKLGLKMMTP